MTSTSSKLELFERVDFTFKVINDYPIEATILIPRALQLRPRAKYATLVNWHGGGFVVGDRMYEGWLPPWLLDLCLLNSAILISPDYRLLPEATTAEVLSDVEDFWKWLHNSLPTLTATWNASPDTSRLACTGQSSGGYLAVQSALVFPHLTQIKLIVSMGSPLYTNFPHYRIPSPRRILGKLPPPPWKAEKIVRSYIKNLQPGAIRTSGDAVEMWEFLTCVLQQAYLPRWLGSNGRDDWEIMELLAKADEFPPIWIIQGANDSVVLPICSTGFVEGLKQSLPDVPLLLTFQPGDHAFEVKHSVDDEWVQKGFQFVGKYWP
ncbi:putative polyketide synthase [Xylogone sp. PMI_703]|nr:putative polyketide synthase [Xylogone sp. PMI_703]